jgi:hypothetical protein
MQLLDRNVTGPYLSKGKISGRGASCWKFVAEYVEELLIETESSELNSPAFFPLRSSVCPYVSWFHSRHWVLFVYSNFADQSHCFQKVRGRDQRIRIITSVEEMIDLQISDRSGIAKRGACPSQWYD